MSETCLVSVVIIVRNGERFLAEAIGSVREQSYRPLELIVVDGHSTDGTELLARSDLGIRFVRQRGEGIADAYNTGIGAARGEFVSFLSHDDLWTPDKLRVQVEYLLAHPQVQYVIAHFRYFLESGCGLPPGFKPRLLQGPHTGRVMETLVARRSLFDLVGGFDATFRIANDVDWFARVKDRRVMGAVLPAVLLHKRVHDANASSDAALNTRELLTILGRSVARQRALRERKP